jgi:catechol 2,3-dioxygenase-like lactoylglutathione lyase family enzyme
VESPTRVERLHHVQLAMPPGGEPRAREFYRELLGIPEVPKPAAMASRGGCWFERGELRIHLGVEAPFRPARKAHPALLVEDLPALLAALRAAGYTCREDTQLQGCERAFVDDPFANRIELIALNGSA